MPAYGPPLLCALSYDPRRMKRGLVLIAILAAFPRRCCPPVARRPSTFPERPPARRTAPRSSPQRCAGCHTFDAAGTQGSATKVSDRERVDGPNFNVRKSCYEDALYAIQNGGYSGAIMPANIVVGQDAKDVARFIAEYSGKQAKKVASPSGPAVVCKPPPG